MKKKVPPIKVCASDSNLITWTLHYFADFIFLILNILYKEEFVYSLLFTTANFQLICHLVILLPSIFYLKME